MKITDKIIKLKKYLFLISILLFITTLSHLVYLYIYNDAKLVPIKGGKVSEALIGNFPTLNPFQVLSGNNKYIIGLLYRSLLTYDINENKIVSDLASCDISNLLYIECYIKDNAKFSDGSSISIDDMVATYKVLQNTNVNPVIASLLSDTTIEENENIITFSNTKKDVNFLNVLFQPIVPKSTIDNMGEDQLQGNFSTINQIYSGDFTIANVEQDLSLGVTKFIFDKNIYNENENIFIDQFEIKLFPDTQTFLKNKDTVNIFNDSTNLIGKSHPRFAALEYSLPQYVSLFINQNKIIDKNLRTLILNQVDKNNLVKILGDTSFQTVENPYLSEKSIKNESGNKNIEQMLSKLGFYKKSKIISKYLPEKTADFYSKEATLDKTDEINVPDNLSLDDYQKDSLSIIEPAYVDKYNFISRDNILIKGVVDDGVTAVYINEYKLQSYTSGNKNFYYRLKESYQTLQVGNNVYKIYFEKDGKKYLKEEISFFYNSDKNILLEAEKNIAGEIYKQEIEDSRKQEAIEQKEIAQKPIDTQKVKEISALDEKFYYNDDLEKYTLNIYYISTSSDLLETAKYTKNKLEELGIFSELRPIQLQNLSSVLSKKDNYDIMIAGINLGYFNYNIFPYFHSSQSKNGYNFSNIRKTSLDILLEDLKSSLVQKESQGDSKDKVLKIFNEEQVVKTLYTPKLYLLVDKNIKNQELSDSFPNIDIRSQILYNTYIKEKNILNFEDKSTTNFIKFLVKKINE